MGGLGRQGQDMSALFDKELQRQQRTNYETRSQTEDASRSPGQRTRARQDSRSRAPAGGAEPAAARAGNDGAARRRDEAAAREAHARAGGACASRPRSWRERWDSRRPDSSRASRPASRNAAVRRRPSPAAAAPCATRPSRCGTRRANCSGSRRRALPTAANGPRPAFAGSSSRCAATTRTPGSRPPAKRGSKRSRLPTRSAASPARRPDWRRATDAANRDAWRRLAGEKDKLADRVDDSAAIGRAARRNPGAGAGSIAANRLRPPKRSRASRSRAACATARRKMREAADAERPAAGGRAARPAPPQGVAEAEQQMAKALEQIARRSGGGAAGAEDLSRQLDESRAIRDRLDRLERQMREADARSAAGRQGAGRAGSAGAGRNGSPGSAAGSGQSPQPAEDAQRLREEYARELRARARLARAPRTRRARYREWRHVSGDARVEPRRPGHRGVQAGLFELGVVAQGRGFRPRTLRSISDRSGSAPGPPGPAQRRRQRSRARRLPAGDRPILRIAGQEEVGRRVLRNPLPWWALALIVGAAALVAWLAYNRRTLSPPRRRILVTLRFVTLLALVVFLLRPVARGVDGDARDAVVAILVDSSRSMSIEDAGGQARVERARRIVAERLLPTLGSQFQVEVLGFGDGVAADRARGADGRGAPQRRGRARSRLCATRYRGRAVAGVILVSDGGDTSGAGERAAEDGPPIYAIGVGSPVAGKDREILGVTAAETILDDSRVDLAVSAVSHGLGKRADRASPAREWPFHRRQACDAGRRGIARARSVSGLARKRRAHGLHRRDAARSPASSFPRTTPAAFSCSRRRAPAASCSSRARLGSSTVFSSVRGRPTPASKSTRSCAKARTSKAPIRSTCRRRSRGATASRRATRRRARRFSATTHWCSPTSRRTSSRARELEATRRFVGERGGGLLVLGARSFLRQGLAGTMLEDVLPLELNAGGGSAIDRETGASDVRRARTSAG